MVDSSSVDQKQVLIRLDDESTAIVAPPAYESTQGLLARTNEIFAAQLAPMAPMSIGGARNAKGQTIGLDGQRTWNHGLCACTERPGLSCAAAFCPCSVWSMNRSRLAHLSATGEPQPSPEKVGLWCGLYALSPQFTFGFGPAFMQAMSRFSTRQRYGIRGNIVEDTLIGLALNCCSLVQEAREIEDEEMALTQDSAAPEAQYRDEEEAVEAPQQ